MCSLLIQTIFPVCRQKGWRLTEQKVTWLNLFSGQGKHLMMHFASSCITSAKKQKILTWSEFCAKTVLSFLVDNPGLGQDTRNTRWLGRVTLAVTQLSALHYQGLETQGNVVMVFLQHQQLAPQNETTEPPEEVSITLLNRAFKTFIFFIKAESHPYTSTLGGCYLFLQKEIGGIICPAQERPQVSFSPQVQKPNMLITITEVSQIQSVFKVP